jgi:hypothetical protein
VTLAALSGTIVHFRDVRVELRALIRREHRSDVRALTLHDCLELGASIGVLTGTLTLVLLAKRLELVAVFLVNVFQAGLLGVGELDTRERSAVTHRTTPAPTTAGIASGAIKASATNTGTCTACLGLRVALCSGNG